MANLADRLLVRNATNRGSLASPKGGYVNMTGYKADPFISCNFSVTIAGLGADFNIRSSNPDRIGFSKISGLGQEILVEEVSQGSNPVVIEIPKGIKNGEVTFERGMSNNLSAMALHQWFLDTVALLHTQVSSDSAARAGTTYGSTRPVIRKRDIVIEVPKYPQSYSTGYMPPNGASTTRNRPVIGKIHQIGMQPRNTIDGRSVGVGKVPGVVITLMDAWPTKFELGPLDANTNSAWIYSMVVRHSGIRGL